MLGKCAVFVSMRNLLSLHLPLPSSGLWWHENMKKSDMGVLPRRERPISLPLCNMRHYVFNHHHHRHHRASNACGASDACRAYDVCSTSSPCHAYGACSACHACGVCSTCHACSTCCHSADGGDSCASGTSRIYYVRKPCRTILSGGRSNTTRRTSSIVRARGFA